MAALLEPCSYARQACITHFSKSKDGMNGPVLLDTEYHVAKEIIMGSLAKGSHAGVLASLNFKLKC